MRAKKWAKEDIGDLFTLRQLTVKMDHGLKKFPDSPFFLSIGGMYFSIKYQITQNKSDLNQALPYLLKSHSILKETFYQNLDFLLEGAKDINFEMIPFIYSWLDQSDKAAEFLFKNKNMICKDSVYECLNLWRLRDYSNIFYGSYHYNEALEILDLALNKSAEELAFEGEKNEDVKVKFYFKSGMIHMKRGNNDIAIDNYNNALKIIEQSDETWNWWRFTLYGKLGFTYYYNNDFENASSYFLKSLSFYNTCDDCKEEAALITLKCYYGLLELLTGNLDTSEKEIHTAESWLNKHPLNKEDNADYDAYLLYWPLYLYYEKQNQSDKANGYLEMAYEIIGKEKIEKYNKHPEKDTHPEFFYCRDIIRAYADNLKQ